ncbi:uncharacterized protein LOC130890683 [Diorhabda carinulata]|uniref:uncharacterized protein LOC130890683 n=1 Tax=Diorhabda carinulata TaxID=1163345 RepID=UPI0025A04A30|nr:uncharacterized protein LOC130890683 [Diorhabda carinulata]
MMSQSMQEEAKLDAMQRHWQSLRRGTPSSNILFEDVIQTDNILALPIQNSHVENQIGACATILKSLSCDLDSDSEFIDIHDCNVTPKSPFQIPETEEPIKGPLKLDASSLGDIPGQYTICALEPHQLPVVGVYIDPRVVPGFKYLVRPLPEVGKPSTMNKCLFNGKALTLTSIGRGYARRFTFESDKFIGNDNYFWSDNRPEGYAFELELLSEGDKFTFFNPNGEPEGTVEVLSIEGPQTEIFSSFKNGLVDKRATVTFTGKVEYYETGVAKPVLLSGTILSRKLKNKPRAEILKISRVNIRRHRYYLLPGIQKIHRRFTVRGDSINDVPTKYTMTGLESYEIPVVGTYVDPRIIPGFFYKVRPNDRRNHLFGGRALRLLSIGMGYAKRLTFQPDSLVEPDNYLWSDSHPDGLGLEPRAVHKGMKFVLESGDVVLGEATVFRDDLPQVEEHMERIKTPNGEAVQKYIFIDVLCHIRLARTGGASTENEEHLMRVTGLAVVRKEPKASEANVIRIENIGFDSQLLILFARTYPDLTLVPKIY